MSSLTPSTFVTNWCNLQLRVLEEQVFGVVTKAELREYERRRERICGLYNQLSKRKAAAA